MAGGERGVQRAVDILHKEIVADDAVCSACGRSPTWAQPRADANKRRSCSGRGSRPPADRPFIRRRRDSDGKGASDDGQAWRRTMRRSACGRRDGERHRRSTGSRPSAPGPVPAASSTWPVCWDAAVLWKRSCSDDFHRRDGRAVRLVTGRCPTQKLTSSSPGWPGGIASFPPDGVRAVNGTQRTGVAWPPTRSADARTFQRWLPPKRCRAGAATCSPTDCRPGARSNLSSATASETWEADGVRKIDFSGNICPSRARSGEVGDWWPLLIVRDASRRPALR